MDKMCTKKDLFEQVIEYSQWDRLTGCDWADFLIIHPEFADKCDWGKFFNSIIYSGYILMDLIKSHPEIIEKINYDWSKLSGHDSFFLLLACPELVDKYTWDKMYPGRWVKLLSVYPEISDKITLDYGIFSKNHWCDLLKSQPQFADKCNKMEEFSIQNWCDLLKSQPSLADKVDWKNFPIKFLHTLFRANKVFEDKFNWTERSSEDLSRLLASFPENLSRIPDDLLQKISFKHPGTYIRLMKIDPRIEKICPWEHLNEDNWVKLLSERPELICHWTGRKLSPYSWVRLIEKHPILALGCPWQEFTDNAWNMLLESNPQFRNLRTIYPQDSN